MIQASLSQIPSEVMHCEAKPVFRICQRIFNCSTQALA
uniref:Uncharacterized protein n=1 Tax=Arundo donax TaxID=35708 RepID=A0A0A8YKM3_ARUDO